jgi:hypothetical protein
MTEMKKPLWRQGDILIQTCASLPAREQLKRKRGSVLVQGETSGHTHSLAEPRTARIFQSKIDKEMEVGTLYLEVYAEQAEIIHPEHATIRLAKGIYRVWRQREYDLKGAFRMVID